MARTLRWWGSFKCLLGFHDWEEEARWVGPAAVQGLFLVCVENAEQGIDMCRRCGERQKFLVADGGRKDFAEYIRDDRE